MIYLASPYNHKDKEVMQDRYEKMVLAVYRCFEKRIPVYSPIVHNHHVAILGDLPRTWEFWEAIDIPMMSLCSELWVVRLPDWQNSHGVREEVKYAIDKLEIPVRFKFLYEL